MTNQMTEVCLNCRRGETEIPLQAWRYQSRALWICPDCLPLLIHKREQLMPKWPPAAGSVKAGSVKNEERSS